ncbi:MAG TPA: glycosyltransferase family 4 protein [Vicinamibacterales bacterium]|nr:glycosyltransferase family 4 protein [Vicinamibacterales bacterium]
MRILLLTQYFWPESFRINDLVLAWRQAGHDVIVLTGLPNYPAGRLYPGYSFRGPYREDFSGTPVRRLPIVLRGPRRGIQLALNYLSFICSAMVLGPFVVRERYDVIFVYAPSPVTQCIPAIWLKFWRRVPVVLWLQDLWPDTLVAVGAVRSNLMLRAFTSLTRWIYGHCNMVLVQSAAFIDGVRRVCPDVRDLRVMMNWADDFYRPQVVAVDAPERHELPPGFVIVFAGNLGSAQSLETAIAAADLIRGEPVSWVFIGDGNQREFLEQERRSRGLDNVIRFLGWRPAEAMPRYLAMADALLVSLRRNPTMARTIPAKLQTSLAMGRPVLAALDGEGARIVQESGAGIVVTPDDPESLAQGALTLLRAGAAERARMGESARAYATRHFGRDRLVADLDTWMRELVGEKS